jgi:hypothetical protein
MTKRTKIILAGLIALVPVSFCGCCVVTGVIASHETAEQQRLIAEGRAACHAPSVWRVRKDQNGSQASDWECASADVVAAETRAADAHTAEVNAAAARQVAAAQAAQAAQPAAPVAAAGCTNTCEYANDHGCDDGRPNSVTSLCDLGTDCNDCGPLGQAMRVPEVAAADSVVTGEAQIAWLPTVHANCERYQAAANEIQQSAIFRENERFVTGKELRNVTGTLDTLSTDQGGDGLTLAVKVGDDVDLSTDVSHPIPLRSAVYQQASVLAEDQCVVFSATVLGASSMMEESKVCDTEYVVRFSSIRPCP